MRKKSDLSRLEDSERVFSGLEGLIIIDEVQRLPDLFMTLRYIHDNYPEKKFLILGSASGDLLKQSSESLAGRISYLDINPFHLSEVVKGDSLWIKGGFPESYLLDDKESWLWKENYIRTYLEKDVPNLGFRIPSSQLERFWYMLAHYHGQIFNGSAIGNSLDISQTTVRKYLDILSSTFMIRVLYPWHENISKRQVKSPKVYIRDSGLLHYIFGIENKMQLLRHPMLGASWEGFALEQILQTVTSFNRRAYFWRTQHNAELDLLLVRGFEKVGIEFKYGDAPKITKSMNIALENLQLDELIVVYPGNISYQKGQIKIMTLEDAIDYI